MMKGKTKDSSEVHCFRACTLKIMLPSITDVSTDSKIKIQYEIVNLGFICYTYILHFRTASSDGSGVNMCRAHSFPRNFEPSREIWFLPRNRAAEFIFLPRNLTFFTPTTFFFRKCPQNSSLTSLFMLIFGLMAMVD